MHHLTQDMKQLLSEAQVAIPLLSPARHGFCDTESLDPEAEKICGAYREQVALGTADNVANHRFLSLKNLAGA